MTENNGGSTPATSAVIATSVYLSTVGSVATSLMSTNGYGRAGLIAYDLTKNLMLGTALSNGVNGGNLPKAVTSTIAVVEENVAVGMKLTNTYGRSTLIAKGHVLGQSLLVEYNA